MLRAGATVEAAEAVCETRLDVLSTLIDHHLVRRTVTRGGSRLWLLETIHEYAAELLVADPAGADRTRARLAEWCLALATEAEPHLSQDQQTEWLDLLETEHDNLRAALDHLDSSGAAEQQLTLAVSLSRFWYVRGHLAEGEYGWSAHSRRPPTKRPRSADEPSQPPRPSGCCRVTMPPRSASRTRRSPPPARTTTHASSPMR